MIHVLIAAFRTVVTCKLTDRYQRQKMPPKRSSMSQTTRRYTSRDLDIHGRDNFISQAEHMTQSSIPSTEYLTHNSISRARHLTQNHIPRAEHMTELHTSRITSDTEMHTSHRTPYFAQYTTHLRQNTHRTPYVAQDIRHRGPCLTHNFTSDPRH